MIYHYHARHRGPTQAEQAQSLGISRRTLTRQRKTAGGVPVAEAAQIVGVSRRTIHRWIEEGRLPYPMTYDALQGVQPRKRGPRRDPHAVRYTRGRHSFREKQ